MYEMLEQKIDELIAALEQNTNALLNGSDAPKVQEEPAKTETAKQKKARLAKEKKDAAKNGSTITVASVKALAKKIALATDNPKECMEQIREVVGITAEACYENANTGIDQFDETGLVLLDEALKAFDYTEPEAEGTGDDLSI